LWQPVFYIGVGALVFDRRDPDRGRDPDEAKKGTWGALVDCRTQRRGAPVQIFCAENISAPWCVIGVIQIGIPAEIFNGRTLKK